MRPSVLKPGPTSEFARTPESCASVSPRAAGPSAPFGSGISESLIRGVDLADAAGTRIAAASAASASPLFSALVPIDREVHVVLRGAEPRAAPAPADRGEGAPHCG